MNLFKRSNGFYYIKFYDSDGIERRISTKCKRKKEALKYVNEFKKELTKPKLILKSYQAIKELFLNYIFSNYSKKHHNEVKLSLKRFELSVEPKNLRSIKKHSIENYIKDRSIKTKYGAYNDLKILKAFFNWSIANSFIENNPCSSIKFPSIPEKENIYITSEKFEKIVEHESNSKMRDIYHFAYLTGMRLGEITNCKLSWIDLKEKILIVKNDESFTTKSKRNRVIPLNDKLIEIVKKYIPKIVNISKDQYLFNRNGFKYNADFISKRFKVTVRSLYGNDTKIHFHNLRGSFGSELIKKGVPTYYVMKLLGHSSIRVTEKNYLSLQVDDLKKAVNLLD